jgi:hypothetical protein
LVLSRASSPFALAALLLAVSGCNAGTFNGGAGSKDEGKAASDKGDEGEDDGEEEPANAPTVVTGVYLAGSFIRCGEDESTDARADETVVGCEVVARRDGDIVKLDLDKVATQSTWSVTSAASAELQTRILQDLPKSSEHHALFLFSAPGEDAALANAIDLTRIGVALDLKDETATDAPRALANRIAEAKTAAVFDPNADYGAMTSLPAGGDNDGDSVVNELDECPASPTKEVHEDGEWRGCAAGELRKRDDYDLDAVENTRDRCPETKLGEKVDSDAASDRYGCAEGQTPR